jgi:hypothetical protein
MQIANYMQICPVGDELFRKDGQTDMMKLIVSFRNFAKAPHNKPSPCSRDIEKLTFA